METGKAETGKETGMSDNKKSAWAVGCLACVGCGGVALLMAFLLMVGLVSSCVSDAARAAFIPAPPRNDI